MAQDLPAAVDTQIAADSSKPVLLFELLLDGGTLRYASATSNVTFPTGGNTYTALFVGFESILTSTEGQIEEAVFQFDNIDNTIYTYYLAEEFDGKEIIVKKVYRDAFGSASYYREVFAGIMNRPNSIDKEFLTLSATNGSRFNNFVLQKYYQKNCNNIFGDTACNKSGYANLASLTASGTADSGTVSTLVDSALTQSNDYWNYGLIEVTISGTTYRRFVKDFASASDTITFDVALPTAVTGTSTYTVYKGCPRTLDACEANNNYGPSSDNSANWLGFEHIGGD